MWVLPVRRRELVDVITPRRRDLPAAVEQDHPSFDEVNEDKMLALWPARPTQTGDLPTVIVVAETSRRELLAWLATYVREFRPFTAYCRVVDKPVALRFLDGPLVPHLHGAEGICSGLVLGEALTQARGRASIFDLPASAYSATLSHAISRTLALTGGSVSPLDVERLWNQAREITGQNGMGVPSSMILNVWAVALGIPSRNTSAHSLFDTDDPVAAAWLNLTTAGDISDHNWRRLVDGYSGLEHMRELLDAPREQRVHTVDRALQILAHSGRHADERSSFLAGYVASLLGPGTLDHADFITPIAPVLPTAFLWYALCAGANMRGDSLPAGNPLARRISRDLTLPDRFSDRPRCDVALEELAVHGTGDNLLRLTSKLGRLDIDILPGVTMSVKWPLQDLSRDDDVHRAKHDEMRDLIGEIERATMTWQRLTERLRVSLGVRTPSRQLPNRKRRGGRGQKSE